MKRLIVIALLASTGCDDGFQKSGTKEEVARLSLQVTELEREIEELKDANKTQDKFAVDTWNALSSLRTTFNSNVDLENKKTLARATERGACGRETVQFADGSWTYRNRECTWKLLGK